jgi:hypothetical protein
MEYNLILVSIVEEAPNKRFGVMILIRWLWYLRDNLTSKLII